jgi:hypothetical protein
MAKTKPRPIPPARLPRAGAASPPAKAPQASGPASTEWVQVKLPVNDRMLDFLKRLGARSDRGRSRWSLANVVREQFDLFLTSLDASDPRATRGFPEPFYELTIELLTEPWSINGTTIKILDAYMSTLPHLGTLLAEAGVEKKAFLAAITELSFTERLHLVEAAHVRHAPRAEPGSPDF